MAITCVSMSSDCTQSHRSAAKAKAKAKAKGKAMMRPRANRWEMRVNDRPEWDLVGPPNSPVSIPPEPQRSTPPAEPNEVAGVRIATGARHILPKPSVIPQPTSPTSLLSVPTDLITLFPRASLPPPLPEPTIAKQRSRLSLSALSEVLHWKPPAWRGAVAPSSGRGRNCAPAGDALVGPSRRKVSAKNGRHIPLDVIQRICVMAQNPLPAKRGDGGCLVPAYGVEVKRPIKIDQTTLATLMRVSKDCYMIAGPLLYSEIITDNLSTLLSHIKSRDPPASGLLSKVALLRRTRHLHIEAPNELLPHQYRQYPSLLMAVPKEEMQYSTTAWIRLTRAVMLMERMVLRGGLAKFFPALETFSTSAYMMPKGVEAFDGQRRTGLANASPERWQSAWTALFSTCPAPFMCEQQYYLAPFQQNGDGAMLYRNVDRSIGRRGIKLSVDVTTFIHIHVLPDFGQSWRVGLQHKMVYLYTHDSNQPPLQPEHLLGAFHRLATHMISLVNARRFTQPSMYMDIELRIPTAALPIFYGFTCPSAMDAMIHKLLEDVHNLYASLLDKSGRNLDKWKVVVVGGRAECPACCCRYDPDGDNVTALELAVDNLGISSLWPDE